MIVKVVYCNHDTPAKPLYLLFSVKAETIVLALPDAFSMVTRSATSDRAFVLNIVGDIVTCL